LAPHPAHPEWQPIELAVYGYRLADTQETAVLRALTMFCARHPDLVEVAPIRLFPPAREDDPNWLLGFKSSQALVASMPTEAAYTFVRCMKVFDRLQALLSQALASMAGMMADSYAHHCERDIRLINQSMEMTVKDTRIADLEQQLAELQIARNAGIDRDALLEAQLEDAQWALGNANEMLALSNEHLAQMEQQGQNEEEEEDPEEVEGVSEMDTEENVPPPVDRPHSPAGSIASVNDLDDF